MSDDKREPLWVKCEKCNGQGTLLERVDLRGGDVMWRSIPCRACEQYRGVLVPVLSQPWRRGHVLNPKAGEVV